MVAEQSLQAGDRAPDFTLKSGSGTDISLGHVLKEETAVLVFYIFDFSGT